MLKKMMLVLSISLLPWCINPVQAEGREVKAVNGIAGGHGSSVFFQKLVSHYQCYGYAANNWEFISANVTGSSYWSAFYTPSMTQAEAVNVPYKKAPELFSATLWGEIIPTAPGEGPPPPTDYTINMEGDIPLYSVKPLSATVIYDFDYQNMFSSYLDDNLTPSIWNVAGLPQITTDSISIGPAGHFNITKGGEYKILAQWDNAENTDVKETADLSVLKVKFIPNSETLSWKTNTQYTPDVSLVQNLIKQSSHKMGNMDWEITTGKRYAELQDKIIWFKTDSKDAGKIVLTVTTKDTDINERKSSDKYTINPDKSSLDIDLVGVSEKTEENPGGFVMENDDDDNVNLNVDSKLAYEDPKFPENDLRQGTINLTLESPISLEFPVKLNVLNTGALSDKVRITTVKNNIQIKNLSNQKKIVEDGVTRIEPIEFSRGAALQVNSGNEEHLLKEFYIYKPKPASRLPASSEVEVSVTQSEARIEIYKTEEDFLNSNKIALPFKVKLSEFTSDKLTYYINAIAPSAAVKDIEIKSEYTAHDGIKCEDIIKATSLMTDIDVDSNNDGEVTQDDIEEDKIELDNPGKIIQVNNGDCDDDGIIDYVDFEVPASDDEGFDVELFRELKIRIDGPITDDAYVKLIYNDSLPPTKEGGKLPKGILRLWTATSYTARSSKTLKDGGDFVASSKKKDKATWYTVKELFGKGNKEISLYIEAVRIKKDQGQPSLNISIEVIQPENNDIEHSTVDEVKITPIRIDIGMDGNRDEYIDFDDVEDSKYLFWVNNDHDKSEFSQTEWLRMEDDAKGTPDCNDNTIGTTTEWGKKGCKRDLEDFTRLHVKVPKLLSGMEGVTYFFKIQGACEANIFEAVQNKDTGEEGTLDYLKVTEVANSQIEKERILTIGANENELKATYIKPDGKKSCFLFEGKKVGKGQVSFILKKDDIEIARKNISLELLKAEDLYEKYTVSSSGSGNDVKQDYTKDHEAKYVPEKKDYLLYIHGWNMSDWEKDIWAETVFKRMWWLGYKGHIGLFSWPTLTANWTGIPGPWNYDNSEQRSWNSAIALKKLLKELNKNHSQKVRVIAHSMGNVVTGDALNTSNGKVVHTYFATQAAISANCYDNSVKLNNPEFTSYKTPNIYGFYTSGKKPDKPYFKNVKKHAKRMVRLYNKQDWALDWWDNNNEMKPDFDYNYSGNKNLYSPPGDRFYHIDAIGSTTLTFPDERFEIFTFALESRSRALGAVAIKINSFGSKVDLEGQSYGYNDHHYSHSRQFRSNVVDENAYWEKIYNEGGF